MSAPKGNKFAAGNKGGGRPTRYKSEYADMAYKIALLGCTDEELGEVFGVSEQTINNWKSRHKEFSLSLTRGKMLADAEVAEKLFHRAKGYSHESVKIFNHQGKEMVVPYVENYPPDTQAASLWLRNRQPTKWRDRQEVDLSSKDGTMTPTIITRVIVDPRNEEGS